MIHDRREDQSRIAPGPRSGRALLQADLRAVSQCHLQRIAQARRPDTRRPRTGQGIGPGKRNDRSRVLLAGRRGIHPGTWPGRDHRGAGPQAANARGNSGASARQENFFDRFPAGFDSSVSDGAARPGRIPPKDMGPPGCALRACHAAVRHGASLHLRAAKAACRNRRVSAGVAWHQLRGIAGVRDLGIPPHHRADRPRAC